MYRRLFLVVSQARNTTVFAEEGGLIFPTTLPIHRSAIPGGQRSLGSSVVVCSEIKDGTAPELPKQEQQQQEDGEKEKAGKDSLLELLASMKVKVTSKKVWDAKVKSKEPVSWPVPVEMASATSTSQQAVDELPSQKATADLPPKKAVAELLPQSKESLSPELVAAASAAASSMPNPKKARSELLKQLRKHEALPEAQRKGDGDSIGSIIAHMKVGKRNNFRQNDRPANQIRFDEDGRGYSFERILTSEFDGAGKRRGLFGENRLNIFSPVSEKSEPDAAVTVPTLTLWDLELANQIASSINTLPRNGFEEMIQWTEEGKLWEYPVNNEAGLEEEASVPFHQHVFLERHLEEGFPSQGPVRHFMELVAAGLSKNPHLTVREKAEHIAWFRRYFQEKEDVLREAEAYLS